ncbi:hypothetical protein DFH11DRAFT_1604172 [Phellopilus nigrolimitatus]|nr:hypothetical protein DFH11DRAFT_1604172 [Phellopilus nigrolimitatus]
MSDFIANLDLADGDGAGAEYVPLMVMEDDDTDGPARKKTELKDSLLVSQGENARSYRPGRLSTLTTTSVWVALAISLLAFLVSAASSLQTIRYSIFSQTIGINIEALRHPSLYLGLERVPEIRARLKMERTIAKLLGETHANEGGHGHNNEGMQGKPGGQEGENDTEKGDDAHHHVVHPAEVRRVSSLYPGEDMHKDGWISLSDTDTTLLEFIIPVIGTISSISRKCTLGTAFPKRRDLHGRLLTIEGAPEIEVYLADGNGDDDRLRGYVTWNNKPSRQRRLGSAQVEFGIGMDSTSLTEFDCSNETSVVIELECSRASVRSGCRVEYALFDSSSDFGFNLQVQGSR